METPKVVILLWCVCYGFASHDGHTIPVEHYETELHNLGEHVEIPETPVRVIKITKTVAVKIPVPYPVKVIEKVPYPVHISKPYPVPVPQIVKVPHVKSLPRLHEHEPLGSKDGLHNQPGQYNVHETFSQDTSSNSDSYEPESHYNSGQSDHSQSFAPYGDDYSQGSSGSSYDAPSHSYYGNAGANDDSLETKSYDDALKNYLHKINAAHGTQSYH